MRRRRRRSAHLGADGTELMLDTVANLFGGIVLIALLIAIMSGQQAHESSTVDEDVARAVINARGDYTRVQSDLVASESALQDLRVLSERVDSARDPSMGEVNAHLAEALVLEQIVLQDDQNKLKRIRSMQGDLEQLEREVDRDSGALEVELRELQDRRERATADRAPAAQLPIRGTTDQPPLHLVLQWGKLFLLQGPGGQSVAGVDLKVVGNREYHFTLDPNAGLIIQDEWEKQRLWTNILAGFPSEKYYAQVFVYDDSYREFLSVRRALVLSGYQYRIVRFMGNDPIVLVPGDTGITD